ncbi:MAG: 1-deoxy-D-xylulose-5-phosphate reductoisomerase [Hyphomicrobiales bacterium]|nr:1-deoxy-D-xylulose-5-phosphate reductoisomerase [Hyphomicrobiales bacterium]
MVSPRAAPRRLVILGATGSIGRSTADLIADHPDFIVEAVVGGSDAAALAAMARRLKARHAALHDERGLAALRAALAGSDTSAAAGEAAVIEAAQRPCDIVVAAIVGIAGLKPTFAALQPGRTMALANKECLVSAGSAFMAEVARRGVQLLPMDSEHNAIFQALNGRDASSVEQMVLTASGGPFLRWSAEAIEAADVAAALAHPNWSMGRKVTIDSAGLMNKGLELIEAQALFRIAPEKLDVVVHPQSVVHGMVSFSDGTVLAGLSVPDMRTPIAHCLGHPDRMATSCRRLDLAALGGLTFEAPDHARFPALQLAIDAMKTGQGLPTVLNAANELAVEAFLAGKIKFGDIARLVGRACEAALRHGEAKSPQTLAEAIGVDHIARERFATP